ncbi:phospholipid scramblase 1-like isoform X2 [Ooceraea biroi]|nr:phospholipid scramblase 1 isoform X2 [Ooceraea biroi]XP_026827907.1 phospholipid scramblase 1-like isoform X2 [Ooceraea biroi]
MNLDYLFVNQKIELLQAFTGWETKNRYTITNLNGETVFYVAEESDVCARLCLSKYRPCEFDIFDQNRQQILRIVRPFRCDSCCCPCYLQTIEVYSGSTLLGSVTQEWSLWRPTFYIRDASGEPVLTIKGPILRFCIDVSFKVKSMDEKHRVGVIQKQWSGFGRELFTVSDMFGISFPRDLDVKIKAVLLGAALLILERSLHESAQLCPKNLKCLWYNQNLYPYIEERSTTCIWQNKNTTVYVMCMSFYFRVSLLVFRTFGCRVG